MRGITMIDWSEYYAQLERNAHRQREAAYRRLAEEAKGDSSRGWSKLTRRIEDRLHIREPLNTIASEELRGLVQQSDLT